MGFRNPLTSLSADQITAGTLPSDVVGQALATATSGRRVVISTPVGDAGRIDFYGDPQGPGDGEGHAAIHAGSYGGVSGRGFLYLQPDFGPLVTIGSRDAAAGGFEAFVDITSADVVDISAPLVGRTYVQDATYGRLRRQVAGTLVFTFPAVAWGTFAYIVLNPGIGTGIEKYSWAITNGEPNSQGSLVVGGYHHPNPGDSALSVRYTGSVAGGGRLDFIGTYQG